jgi:hypothetical protein
MKNLYLVTQEGERHEDHTPVGVYDFETLQEKFGPLKLVYDSNGNITPTIITDESQLRGNIWEETYRLAVDQYEFTEEEIERWKSGNFTAEDNEDGGLSDSEYVENFYVIKIVENMEFPGT